MIARVVTVAFCDLDVRSVEVECTLAAGLPGLTIIGLAEKAVSEARERVRSALPACLWRCRQSGLPSALRQSTCPKRAHISILQSRWLCLARSRQFPVIACKKL